ncbi:MAG: 16S rRNA (guanine(966)-N(2))-methyltransferase RsmD [Anaerolineae bacterium]|nr:16S rRNA (guanine(966)-N(2))-methyltransferase RsmD [Anaerolineae bacterium]
MSIRVIAGSAKGRKLKLVPGDSTRPVMDRVKEALFNIIGRDIFDATFLDLFAGTGSVGIEALSRGAKRAVFIELDKKAVQTIQDNLAATRLADKASVQRADAINILKQPPANPYDFIYVAPPQYKGMWVDVLRILDATPLWVGPDTTIIVQIDPKEETALELTHLETDDRRIYGNTLLWFFRPVSGQKPEEM